MLYAPQTRRLTELDQMELGPEDVRQSTVMVIDDSMTVRAVVEATLSRWGHRVVSFEDGLVALGAMAREEVEIPDLVLLDIGLPRMSGIEICRILRAKREFDRTSLVMLSCHDSMITHLQSKLAGANAFINKPFRARYLAEVVNDLLKRGAHS